VAAIGQGAGGGAGAPGAGGGAAAPAPGTGTPPAGAAPTTDNDPWGLNAALTNAPEHLRPMLQTEFDRISPMLSERAERFAPVEPFLERLTPLLEADDQGNTVLDGLLAFYQMTGDESQLDAFQDWWDQVGASYGFFDDEQGGGAGGEGAAAAPAGEPTQDPRDAQIAELKQQVDALKGEFTTTQQRQAVDQAAQRISSELVQLMQAAKIEGHDQAEPLKSAAAGDILRLAQSYGEDPQAISKATADYLRMTGQAQSALVTGAGGQDVSGLEALQAALAAGGPAGGGGGAPAPRQPGPSLGRGNADYEPEPVRAFADAKEIAMQRMREAGHV
jgi:hypothetical protein